MLIKFRTAYGLAHNSSLETLLSVNRHYAALLQGDGKVAARGKSVSSKEVSRVIKQGYETLSIQAREGLDRWDRYREADHKALMKRITRTVVEDARCLLAEGK